MRVTPARTAILQALGERLTLSDAMRLVGEACAVGAEMWSFDERGVAPAEACARAVHQLLHLEAATAVVEEQLAGEVLDANVAGEAIELVGALVYLGHAALRSHAVANGYDPRRRIESMHVYARMQLERVGRALEAGAGRRCLVVCIEPIADAVAVAMVQAGRDDVAFVDAAVEWAGASLGLYALALAVSA